MAYYCGECTLWQGSDDVNRYGERWCPYSKRYEKSNQEIYGCRGFVYAERAILTKVCEILGFSKEAYFRAFDNAKSRYIVPQCMDKLVNYSSVGPQLAECLEADADQKRIAQLLLWDYIAPAKDFCETEEYEKAVEVYTQMVDMLRERYSMKKEIRYE